VILTASEGADAVVAGQPAERLPVLHAAKVSGEIRQAAQAGGLPVRRFQA